MVKYYCNDNNFEKMKLTALVILLSFSLKISGQQINQPSNHYRNGDMLEKRQVKVEGFDLNSKNGVWGLEDAEISKKSFSTEYTAEADTMMMQERGNRTYLHQGNVEMMIRYRVKVTPFDTNVSPSVIYRTFKLNPVIHYTNLYYGYDRGPNIEKEKLMEKVRAQESRKNK